VIFAGEVVVLSSQWRDLRKQVRRDSDAVDNPIVDDFPSFKVPEYCERFAICY
jgi:hypothetical protein